MKNLFKFVVCQFLSTIFIVAVLGSLFSLVPNMKNVAIIITWIFIYSAAWYGLIPCILGGLLNQSNLIKTNFKVKSTLSWLFSFLLTMFIWLTSGHAGGSSELMGRLVLIVPAAILAFFLWMFFANKFLKKNVEFT